MDHFLVPLTVIAIVATFIFVVVATYRMSFAAGIKAGYIQSQAEHVDQTIQRAFSKAFKDGSIDMPGYEDQCMVTWTMGDRFPKTLAGFVHLTHKLAGEAGEFNEHWGKAIRDDEVTYQGFINGKLELTPQRRETLLKELGDVLWYVAMLSRELGSSLMGVALMNMSKLASRRARGTIQGSGDDR